MAKKKKSVTKTVAVSSKFIPAVAIPGAVVFQYSSKGYSKASGVPVEEINCQMSKELADILVRCGRKARNKRWQRKENKERISNFIRLMESGEMYEFVVHLMVNADGSVELCSEDGHTGVDAVYTSDGLHKATAADICGYDGLVQVKIWEVHSKEAAARHLGMHDSTESVRGSRERAGYVFCKAEHFQYTTTTLAEMNSCVTNILECVPRGGGVCDSVPEFRAQKIHTIANYERLRDKCMSILKWYNKVLRLENHRTENKGMFHVGSRTAIVHAIMAIGEQTAWPIWKKLIGGANLSAKESSIRSRLLSWILDKSNNKSCTSGQLEEYNRCMHAFMALSTSDYAPYKPGRVYTLRGIMASAA